MKTSFKSEIETRDRWLRIIGIPANTLFATFVLSGFFEGVDKIPLWQIFFSNLVNTWVGWEISRGILLWTRKKFPGIDQVKTRLSIVFSLYFLVVILMNLIIIFITKQFDLRNQYNWTPGKFILAVFLGTCIAMTIGCLYEAVYFFALWKKTTQEKEQLRTENLHSQLESLRNQVNPHFLFNSLNSLSSLIEIDKKKAVEFILDMSRVYRYILESNEYDLTSLKLELDFIRSYFYLLNTRFGGGLIEKIDLPDHLLLKKIPPLTLQILVENAVKHNIVSINKPLYLKIISSGENEITVINNLQKKNNVLSSNNFGLKNINNRYELLNQPGIKIIETPDSYCVSVQLIN